MENFSQFKEKINIITFSLENKNKYYMDVYHIENSWIGRLDAQIANTFLQESIQMIINSIALFEKGYFDCAYYSLRQSLEISTTMIYLTELDDNKKEVELKHWKTKSKFPMFSQMVSYLLKNENVFKEIFETLNKYFSEIKIIKSEMDKYVHKQGFDTFYISRNHPLSHTNNENFIEKFEYYIKKCIGAIAVFRLCIDPFPILLNDEEIYFRIEDIICENFPKEFIEEYIGDDIIKLYKQTNFYNSYHNYFMNNDKMPEYIANIIKNNYIDRENLELIIENKKFLPDISLAVVYLMRLSEKISNIHCYEGLLFYFSNIKSKKNIFPFNSDDFVKLKKNENKINNNYGEVFITIVNIKEEFFFIEHNEEFNENEKIELESTINEIYNEIEERNTLPII